MKDLMIVESALLKESSSLRFGMSTRRGGVSPEPLGMNLSFRVNDEVDNVVENRRRLFTALGLDPKTVAIPLQCHSDHIEVVAEPGEYENSDALITNRADLPLVVSVADCLAVILFDPVKHVLAVVHAGWRGTARTIAAKSVVLLTEKFGVSAKDLVAFLSPCAGPCCYEVGHEVADVFAKEHVRQRDGRLYFDLKKANADQLLMSGVPEANIEVSPSCTICNPDLFHSFRRDGSRSGRMMAVACLLDGKGA